MDGQTQTSAERKRPTQRRPGLTSGTPWAANETEPAQIFLRTRFTETLTDRSFVSRSPQNAPFLQTADCIEGEGDQRPLLQTPQCVPQLGQVYPPGQNAIPDY